MPSAESRKWRTSRYNFRVETAQSVYVFTSRTGALLQLVGPHAITLSAYLTAPPTIFPVESLPPQVFEQLVDGGFLTSEDTDELSLIRERFWNARVNTPLVFTITTTMDCNLGCYYCYETRSKEALQTVDIAKIVNFAGDRLRQSAKKSLHVDWYGGEPFLNLTFLEEASLALQSLCRNEEVAYQASVISNGTSWPDEVGEFLQKHKIRQVQISFDGLRENHNRRRHFREGFQKDDGSSFDEAVNLVSKLLDRKSTRLNSSHVALSRMP